MLIKTSQLTKTYGKEKVVDNLNLEIKEGNLIAYIGTNGAGKSTTMKMLAGLLAPSSGKIDWADKLKIGMVFQDSVLDDELTVLSNLKSRQSLYQKKDQVWFQNLIAMTGIQGFLHQTYGSLSGGQRRRVDIVRALLHKPNLLFLDEPTTGLDIQTRQAIWNLLNHLKREEKLTIFLTTHYLEEAEHADMTYIIDHGKIIAQGSARELKDKYAQTRLLIQTSHKEAFDAESYTVLEDGRLEFKDLSVAQALEILGKQRTFIEDFDFQQANINDVFLSITGREMD